MEDANLDNTRGKPYAVVFRKGDEHRYSSKDAAKKLRPADQLLSRRDCTIGRTLKGGVEGEGVPAKDSGKKLCTLDLERAANKALPAQEPVLWQKGVRSLIGVHIRR